jgi:hypothetical protein
MGVGVRFHPFTKQLKIARIYLPRVLPNTLIPVGWALEVHWASVDTQRSVVTMYIIDVYVQVW